MEQQINQSSIKDLKQEIVLSTLLSKFKNGESRYEKSSIFNTCINSLMQGSDPITIIDRLVSALDATQKQLEFEISRRI